MWLQDSTQADGPDVAMGVQRPCQGHTGQAWGGHSGRESEWTGHAHRSGPVRSVADENSGQADSRSFAGHLFCLFLEASGISLFIWMLRNFSTVFLNGDVWLFCYCSFCVHFLIKV